MNVNEPRSRRSFLTELLTRAAGAWLAGGALVAACAPTPKYGGPPSGGEESSDPSSWEVAEKYGGPPQPASDAGSASAGPEDAGGQEPVTKYGGPPDIAPAPAPEQPVTKYGGPPRPPADGGRPVTKYGGPWR